MASNILGLPPLLGMKEEEDQVNLLGLPPLASNKRQSTIQRNMYGPDGKLQVVDIPTNIDTERYIKEVLEPQGYTSGGVRGALENTRRIVGGVAEDIINAPADLAHLAGDAWGYATGQDRTDAEPAYQVDLVPDPVGQDATALDAYAEVVGLPVGGAGAVKAAEKGVRIGDAVLPDIVGTARAIKDRDVEFLKGWNKAEDTTGIGARPTKERTILMKTPDGEILEMSAASAAQSIADATGKAKKTIQNRIAGGKSIEHEGYSWVEKKPGENRPNDMLFDKEDLRASTAGKIKGYDGTFSDLMRDHGIDPRSEQANTIRQRMERGHDFEGYKNVDAPDDPYAKQQAEFAGRKELGHTIRRRNAGFRLDKLGLDSSNPAIVEEFKQLWKSPTKSDPTFLTKHDKGRINSRKNEKNISYSRAKTEYLTERAARDPKAEKWVQFFEKHYPEFLVDAPKTKAKRRTWIIQKLRDAELGQEATKKDFSFISNEIDDIDVLDDGDF